LPFITIFPNAEAGLYQFNGVDGSANQNEICGLKAINDGLFIFLGFPLYYIQQSDVSSFFSTALQEISTLDLEDNIVAPEEFQTKAYPNPFNPTTTIMFNLPNESGVNLAVYNVKGQKIKSLIHNEQREKGRNEVSWNGKDQQGKAVSSGIYFYRLETDQRTAVQKILLMK